MTKEELCIILAETRRSHLEQAHRLRRIHGYSATVDQRLKAVLDRHDENAASIDQLMIDVGCMEG